MTERELNFLIGFLNKPRSKERQEEVIKKRISNLNKIDQNCIVTEFISAMYNSKSYLSTLHDTFDSIITVVYDNNHYINSINRDILISTLTSSLIGYIIINEYRISTGSMVVNKSDVNRAKEILYSMPFVIDVCVENNRDETERTIDYKVCLSKEISKPIKQQAVELVYDQISKNEVEKLREEHEEKVLSATVEEEDMGEKFDLFGNIEALYDLENSTKLEKNNFKECFCSDINLEELSIPVKVQINNFIDMLIEEAKYQFSCIDQEEANLFVFKKDYTMESTVKIPFDKVKHCTVDKMNLNGKYFYSIHVEFSVKRSY